MLTDLARRSRASKPSELRREAVRSSRQKGTIAFVSTVDYLDKRFDFTIVWSCGGDRLPTGEAGNIHVTDIDEMIEEGLLYEVNESTDLCQQA